MTFQWSNVMSSQNIIHNTFIVDNLQVFAFYLFSSTFWNHPSKRHFNMNTCMRNILNIKRYKKILTDILKNFNHAKSMIFIQVIIITVNDIGPMNALNRSLSW